MTEINKHKTILKYFGRSLFSFCCRRRCKDFEIDEIYIYQNEGFKPYKQIINYRYFACDRCGEVRERGYFINLIDSHYEAIRKFLLNLNKEVKK